MKRILITGANSYIGTSFKNYMSQFNDEYSIDTIDITGDDHKKRIFSNYDCVFHVADIAQQKETSQNSDLYYKFNRDLAVFTAQKAKHDGVKQFIILSSINVYGLETGVITKDTAPAPKCDYARSKLQADKKILSLADDHFKVSVLRLPTVYGKGCKEYFRTIINLLRLFPVFPKLKNQRSMIYIYNLCEFLKMCIDNELNGVFFPQNKEYLCTTDIARIISEDLGKKVYFSRFLGLLISVFGRYFSVTRKTFGSLVYKDTEVHDFSYDKYGNKDSVRNCFRKNTKQKKVLFVATVVREHINAFHVPFLKLFKEYDWQTTVAARNDYFDSPSSCHINYCDKYYDIPFERPPFKMNNLKAYKELKKLIDSEHYDIIHCHTPVGAMLTRIAARNARKKGTKVIYTAHGFHFFKGSPLKNWILYFSAEWLLSFFTDKLITINQEDYLLAEKKLHAKETFFVPGVGIDIDKYRKVNSTRNELIKEFGTDENVFIITSVGELIERKNFKTLIKAVKLIKNENIICLICGSGNSEAELKKLVSDSGLDEKIKFLGFRNDINRILHGSDVFVFPTYQEGLPVALMEAMAAGLPIITSDIRGNSDLIQNNKNGFLVNPEDHRSIAQKLTELMSDREHTYIMGKNAKNDIQQYSLDKVKKQMERIYFE